MATDSVIGEADLDPVLRVELLTRGSDCRLSLRGDLRDTTLAALEAQVDQLGCMPCHEVIVDLTFLTGMDGVGANVIVGLYYYVIARGGSFLVTGALQEVAATLRGAGDGVIPIDVREVSVADSLP